jgi:7-cyano-7-deazaguanine synthase
VNVTRAILISGGLDSAILLGDALRRGDAVVPIYIRCGLAWEAVELTFLHRYLAALASPSLQPLVILNQPVADIYGKHWSVTGERVPRDNDPDEMVFLPGRNVLLLGKAILWCHLNGVSSVALGSLQTNPFPDATPEFFAVFVKTVNQAVGGRVELKLPFAGMKKTAVMKLGEGLPLEHSFSCIQPKDEIHCGTCNKCGERKEAFRSAGMADPTRYAQ